MLFYQNQDLLRVLHPNKQKTSNFQDNSSLKNKKPTTLKTSVYPLTHPPFSGQPNLSCPLLLHLLLALLFFLLGRDPGHCRPLSLAYLPTYEAWAQRSGPDPFIYQVGMGND